jgi:hypothetical protein
MKIPFYKTGRFLTAGSAIVVAVAVGLIVLFADQEEAAKSTSFISPPIAQVTIPVDSFTVDADSATEITYRTGSKLHIPANAFKDEKGALIKGKVNLRYREFHDQKDIFISGIPMTYDSAEFHYVFESAGMMDISATQGGKSLTANAEQPIKVDMVSNTKEDKYNTYYLDTAAKKWIDLHQANLISGRIPQGPGDSVSEDTKDHYPDAVTAKYEQELKIATAAVRACENQKPIPVAKADKSKTTFHIVIDAGEFPELSVYQGVRFQVKDETGFNPASAKTEWENVKLKKLNGIDYQVTFTKGEQKMQVVATPVVSDKDLPAAQKVYDQKYAQYEKTLADRKASEAKVKAEYEARLAEMRKRMDESEAESKDREAHYEKTLSQKDLVYRTFVVNYFGTYNCDHAIVYPEGRIVAADFTSEQGEELHFACVYLVERDRNVLYPYQATPRNFKDFRFDPSRDNMIWAVTTDDKLVTVDVASFKAQQTSDSKIQFKCKVTDRKFSSCDEVKKFLQI